MVCLLSKGDVKSKKIRVEFSLEDMDMDTDGFKKGATYKAIRDWIKEKYGYRVTNLNIAQVKQKHGIIERENYNKPKSPDSKQPGCPSESPISEADLNATNDMPPTKGRGYLNTFQRIR
ncbi:MAG: RNA methyltransferase [Lachnospiraceae bacterium]|nr:RNA methyltransferase [Lachnospiraceae bacterium]